MTIEEFNNTAFGANTIVIYKGKEYEVFSVDFEEKLIAIAESQPEYHDEDFWPDWKRCENVTLKTSENLA